MTQGPFALVIFPPQMRRTKLIDQFSLKIFWIDFQIFHHLIEIAVWKFAIKALDQSNCFVTRNVFVANLLRSIIGRTTNAKFDKCCRLTTSL